MVWCVQTALLPTLYQQRKKTKIPVKTIGWPGIHVEDPRDQEEVSSECIHGRGVCVGVHPSTHCIVSCVM